MDGLVGCLAKTARGLADLHACQARPFQVVTLENELAEIRALLARLGTLIPELVGAATPLLTRLEALARKHPADPLRPAHRSFRPAQVLLCGGAIAFIDFDRSCRAEPALDVALFRAVAKDVGLRALQAKDPTRAEGQPRREHLAQLDELCEGFSARYEWAAPVSRRRVALWEALELLRLVLHSWTKLQFDRLAPRLALLRNQLRAIDLAE
jgi:aminoglycoside phosphotransferase (APT) family kinase protein